MQHRIPTIIILAHQVDMLKIQTFVSLIHLSLINCSTKISSISLPMSNPSTNSPPPPAQIIHALLLLSINPSTTTSSSNSSTRTSSSIDINYDKIINNLLYCHFFTVGSISDLKDKVDFEGMNFEQLVIEHFYKRAKSFITACTSYYNGAAQIGSHTSIESSQNMLISTNKNQSSKNFSKKLKKLHEELQKELSAKGIDLDTLISRIMSDSKAGDSNNSEYFSAQSDRISHCDIDESFSAKEHSTVSENVEIVNGGKGKKARKGSKLKQACKYLLKLGKKVLPMEN